LLFAAMRPSASQPTGTSADAVHGPALVGAGLAILIAANWWPFAPVITAMAIISLGATDITLARYRRSSALLPVVMLHGFTYACLYALCVGARLHSAMASATPSASLWAALDVAVSLLPIAIATQRIVRSLRPSTMPPG
jgi:hypothetical protein